MNLLELDARSDNRGSQRAVLEGRRKEKKRGNGQRLPNIGRGVGLNIVERRPNFDSKRRRGCSFHAKPQTRRMWTTANRITKRGNETGHASPTDSP